MPQSCRFSSSLVTLSIFTQEERNLTIVKKRNKIEEEMYWTTTICWAVCFICSISWYLTSNHLVKDISSQFFLKKNKKTHIGSCISSKIRMQEICACMVTCHRSKILNSTLLALLYYIHYPDWSHSVTWYMVLSINTTRHVRLSALSLFQLHWHSVDPKRALCLNAYSLHYSATQLVSPPASVPPVQVLHGPPAPSDWKPACT